MPWVIGARWVCLPCRRRGVESICPRRGAPRLDLAAPDQRERLLKEWSATPAYLAGSSVWSPLAAWRIRPFRWFVLALSGLVAVAAAVLSWLHDDPPGCSSPLPW